MSAPTTNQERLPFEWNFQLVLMETARFCTKETNRLNRIISSEVSDVSGPGSGYILTPGYQEETRRPAALNELPVVPGVLSDDLENYFFKKTTMTISSVWLQQQLHFVSKTSKKVLPFFRDHSTGMNCPMWNLPGITENSIQMVSALEPLQLKTLCNLWQSMSIQQKMCKVKDFPT